MKTLKHRKKLAGLGLAALMAFAMITPQQAKAGDQEWAVVGKVLTGVTAAHLLFNVIPNRVRPQHREVVHSRTRVIHRAPPVHTVRYVAPAPSPRRVVVDVPLRRVHRPRYSRFAYVQSRRSPRNPWVTVDVIQHYR